MGINGTDRPSPIAPKFAIHVRMQFFNDFIKSGHGFRAAEKFHKFKEFYQYSKIGLGC